MLILFIFNSYRYHRMQPKDIRIHKAIADQIKIVNYANQNSIHMAADKYGVETKSMRNWKKQLPELLKCHTNLSKVLSIMQKKQNWWSRK